MAEISGITGISDNISTYSECRVACNAAVQTGEFGWHDISQRSTTVREECVFIIGNHYKSGTTFFIVGCGRCDVFPSGGCRSMYIK